LRVGLPLPRTRRQVGARQWSTQQEITKNNNNNNNNSNNDSDNNNNNININNRPALVPIMLNNAS